MGTEGQMSPDEPQLDEGVQVPVSYTHLDVYKRQPSAATGNLCPVRTESEPVTEPFGIGLHSWNAAAS